MDSLTGYACCSKAAPAANAPSAAMHVAAAKHEPHNLNHPHHHHHHHHFQQQQQQLHHHQQQQQQHQQAANPVVFYLPNQQQQQNGGVGSHYGGQTHQTPYGNHQPQQQQQQQQNHYQNYHQTSVANYNAAVSYQSQVQQQQQQQAVVEQAKNKQPSYPSIYNNNSKLNIFQPFYSGNIYEEASKSLMVSDSSVGGNGDYGQACSYTVANSANSPTGGNLSTSSGYFSSNSSSPSTSSSVRSTSRCDSARSVESSCSSTDSGVEVGVAPNYVQQTYGAAQGAPPPPGAGGNNFVLVPVNASPPTSAAQCAPLNFPQASSVSVPVSGSSALGPAPPASCMQPQQRLPQNNVGGGVVGAANNNNNVMLNQQQPPSTKQPRTDIAVPYGWRRLLVNNTIVYVSPSGAEICSREVARQYLITPGNCKCGLECPLHLDNVFCFDPKVTNRAWPLIPDPSDNTRLCNHRRKQQVPAALLASAPGGPRSPLHRNLIPNPSKDGQSQQLVNVGGGRKKRRKVEAATTPYDRNLVSQLLAQRERLESHQQQPQQQQQQQQPPVPSSPLTTVAAAAPTAPPLVSNKEQGSVPRVWDGGPMAPQQQQQHLQMPPPHYAHHPHPPHLPHQAPPRVPCHPMMTPMPPQQQQQHAPQQAPAYRGFPPPPPPTARPNFGGQQQHHPQPPPPQQHHPQEQHHLRTQPQRLPPPPYIYPPPPPTGGGFYPQQPQQQQQVPPPMAEKQQWPYDKEAHQLAWDDLAKRKKLKIKKKASVAAVAPTPADTRPPEAAAAPSFMEDPNGYLAQQTALLNSTILRQNFPAVPPPIAPAPTPPPPPPVAIAPQPPPVVVVAAPPPPPLQGSSHSSKSSTSAEVPLPSNVALPKGINRTPPAAPATAPDSASECHACTLIKEESQPAVTSTASPDPKGPIQGGTVSTSQEQQEKSEAVVPVAATTPASTKSPLEMVQSVVSSIQVPAAPPPAPPPPRLTATPLALPAAPDLKTTQLPTGHFLVSSNGQQLIFQGTAPKPAPQLSALQQPMMQLVNTCSAPLLLHQPMQQTVTVEGPLGPLLAALPQAAEDPKKRAKKRRPIQQAPAPQHPPQQQQQQILHSPLIMQNFQQPLLQTVTILPNKQQHQFLLPAHQTNQQQQASMGMQQNPINLIQPLNLLNTGGNFMSQLPFQTLVVPGLQGLQVMSALPEGTLIPTEGGATTMQLQLPNQILMQPQFGQQNLMQQMVIRAPGHQLLNKITTTGQMGQLISPQSQFLGFQQTLNGLTMLSSPKPPEQQQQQFIMNVNGQPMIIPCSTQQTPTTQSATLLQQNTTIVQQQTTTALVAGQNQQQQVQMNPLILKQFQDLTGPLLLQQKHSVSTQTAQAAAAAALMPTMVQIPTSIACTYSSPPMEQMPPDTTTSSPVMASNEPLKSLTPIISAAECGVTSSDQPDSQTTFTWLSKEHVQVESSDKRGVKRKSSDLMVIEENHHLRLISQQSLEQEQRVAVSLGEGDLVWGPANGSPSWPGKLVPPPPTPPPSSSSCLSAANRVWVRWFGGVSAPTTQVDLNSLQSLSEGLEAHHRATKKLRKGRKMNAQLEKAIQEAMSELDAKSPTT